MTHGDPVKVTRIFVQFLLADIGVANGPTLDPDPTRKNFCTCFSEL